MGDSVWGIPRSQHCTQSGRSSFKCRPPIKATKDSTTPIPCCYWVTTNLGCHLRAAYQGLGVHDQGASPESHVPSDHMGGGIGSIPRRSYSLGSYQERSEGSEVERSGREGGG